MPFETYNEDYCNIFNFVHTKKNEEDICRCDIYYSWCECDTPRVLYTLVCVNAIGNPIRTKPLDSIYSISIFQTETRCDINVFTDFDESNMLFEFSIENTISRDADSTYLKFLQYCKLSIGDIQGHWANKSTSNFSGQGSKVDYIKAFCKIVGHIINASNKPEPISENAHVSKRKKKTVNKRELRAQIKADKKIQTE
jgi:hypothetical protein